MTTSTPVNRRTAVAFGGAALWGGPGRTAHAAEPGVSDHEVVIGQSAPLTGPAAQLGLQMRTGAAACFAAINDQGGVNGRRIRLVSLDDGYEPVRTAANTRSLIDDERVFALFGYVGTPTSNAALPILTQNRVPFLAPLTGANSLRTPLNRFVFNVRASYDDETRAIVRFLAEGGVKRFAVLYQNDAYGESGLAGVRKALADFRLDVLAVATVERNTTDVGQARTAIQAVNPQVVVIVSTYASGAAFIKAMRAGGSTAQFWNLSFVGSTALADALGSQGVGVAISQVVPFPWADRGGVATEHRRLMGARPASFTTLEGFMAAKVFVEGLRRAGKKPTRKSFVDGLEGPAIDVGGFGVSFSPTNHNGSKFVDLTMLSKDGKFIR